MSDKVLVKLSEYERMKRNATHNIPINLDQKEDRVTQQITDLDNCERRNDLQPVDEYGNCKLQDWKEYIPEMNHCSVQQMLSEISSHPFIKNNAGSVYVNEKYIAPLSTVLFSLYGNLPEFEENMNNLKTLLQHEQNKIPGEITENCKKRAKCEKKLCKETSNSGNEEEIVSGNKKNDEWSHLDKYF